MHTLHVLSLIYLLAINSASLLGLLILLYNISLLLYICFFIEYPPISFSISVYSSGILSASLIL